MVEFALLLPVLLLLLVGGMWLAVGVNYWIDETHLTREAARYAAVNYNPGPGASLQDSILEQADTPALRYGDGNLVADAAQVCISFPENAENGSIGQVGDPVQATMSVTFNFLGMLENGIGDFFDGLGLGPSIPITSTATMRLEALPEDIVEGCTG